MNKFLTVFAIALVFAVPTLAHADVDASSTPSTGFSVVPGGYSTVCSYILAYQPTCDNTQYNQSMFGWDSVYRESILAPWRLKIFGPKYNHQND